MVENPIDGARGDFVRCRVGVSVDDVLYFTVFFRNELARHRPRRAMVVAMEKAGGGIVQTTLIIDAGLAVLAFSSISAVTYSGLLAACALSFSTLTTLFVVPRLLVLSLPRSRSSDGM